MLPTIGFFLAAVVSTAKQGSAVEVKIPNEPHVTSVAVVWREEKVPTVLEGKDWVTILGVDLDTTPGQQKTEAIVKKDDGSVERRELSIGVVAETFPSTNLK